MRLDPLGGLDLTLLHAIEGDLQALAILRHDLDVDVVALHGLHKQAHREHDFLQHWLSFRTALRGWLALAKSSPSAPSTA
jgi:hypothetical protein